jgi:conjugative transfer signal peptidase TraF
MGPSPLLKLLSESWDVLRHPDIRSISLSRYSRAYFFFGLISFGVALAVAASSSGLRFNLTSSLPIGLYRVTNDSPTLERGAIVLYCLSSTLAGFAHDRGYVPRGGQCPGGLAPIGKMVAALPGDTVVITDDGITVNGTLQLRSRALEFDRSGKLLPRLGQGSYLIHPGHIWLLAPSARSFDSRYLGELSAANVIARVRPFWIGTER